jgi:hypothetical protein
MTTSFTAGNSSSFPTGGAPPGPKQTSTTTTTFAASPVATASSNGNDVKPVVSELFPTPPRQPQKSNNNTASLPSPVPVSSPLSVLAGRSVVSSSSSSNGLVSSASLAGDAGRGKIQFAPYSVDAPKLARSSSDSSRLFDEQDEEEDENAFAFSFPSVPGGPTNSPVPAPVSRPAGGPGSSSENPILFGVVPAGPSSTLTPTPVALAPTQAVRDAQADKLAYEWVNSNRLRTGYTAWTDVVKNRTLARTLFERNDFLTKNERAAAGTAVFTSLLPPSLAGPDPSGPVIIPPAPGTILKTGSTAAIKRKAEEAKVEANKRQQLEAAARAAAAAAAATEAAADEEDTLQESDDTVPDLDEEPEGSPEGFDTSSEQPALVAWNKVPVGEELKAVVPPAWWKPAKATAIESAKSIRLREAEELAFASVPLITNDKARRTLVTANSIPSKAITWPKAYVPDKELKDVKSETHLHSKQLYKLLKTELPAVVNRDADVLGVVLALTNTLDGASVEDVKSVLMNAVIPLLIDNNMRTSDVLQRFALELFGIKTEAATTGKSETVNASSYELPIMRHHLDTKRAEEKVAKSLAKVQSSSSSRPPSSSASSSKRGRGSSTARQFTGPASHSNGRGGGGGGAGWNKPSTRGRGGGSSRGFGRGSSRGNGRGGGRGGGRGSSSTSNKSQDF